METARLKELTDEVLVAELFRRFMAESETTNRTTMLHGARVNSSTIVMEITRQPGVLVVESD